MEMMLVMIVQIEQIVTRIKTRKNKKMTNYLIAEAERISDENAEYSEWVMENEDKLIQLYNESEDKNKNIIDDVPNDFISDIYNNGGL